MNNLPRWNGASKVYSNAYNCLAQMPKRGHIRSALKSYYTSQEMDDLIEALNNGNEERIKGLLLLYLEYGYYSKEEKR